MLLRSKYIQLLQTWEPAGTQHYCTMLVGQACTHA
jgi:hypothetical protein